MMSGCGILTNGKGSRREYGEYNLDELTVRIFSYHFAKIYGISLKFRSLM